MDKLKMHSPDLSQDNISKIKALFPNCVTEVKGDNGNLKLAIDFDQLKQELSDSIVEGPQERYHLNWPGKRETLLTANAPIAKTLRPCPEESVNFDTTENLFIEGDNLDALKLLQETYLSKVNVIYIDPPYNTGKDFIYADNFAEKSDDYLKRTEQKDEGGNCLIANTESNGRFHSDWLSMIYSRLKLARNLLSDDGVIFISIDDNEVSNITKVCDEIFGRENKINTIIHNKLNSKNDTVNVQRNHEYIICYRKKTTYISSTKIKPSLEREEVETQEVFREDDRYYLIKDPITTRGDGGTLNKRKNLGYSIYYNPIDLDFMAVRDYDINLAETSNNEQEVYNDNKDLLSKGYIIIRPPKVRGKLGAWTWELDKFNLDKDQILIKETRNGYSVRKRVFVESTNILKKENRYYIVYKKVTNSRSILEYSTNDGSTQLSSVLGKDGVFNNPKNINLIQYLIALVPDKNGVFLDFFSGSASSIHALMQQNQIDNGKRKFIAIQLPEVVSINTEAAEFLGENNKALNISEISKERIRRVGQKLQNENIDFGFRVLKVDSSNMTDIFYRPDQVDQTDMFAQVENIKADRTDEDLLFQVLLDWGVGLTLPISKQQLSSKDVFFVNADENGEGADLIACFGKDISNELIKALAEKQPLRVVFRDDGFANDSVKINVEQIFKQISPMTDVKSI